MRTRSIWHSFQCAFAGLAHIIRTQRNARIHIVIALVVVIVGFYLNIRTVDWAILAIMVGVVFAAEAFNTAVEAAVDLLSAEHHEQARVAKDAAACGVLVLSLVAVVVGLLILGLPMFERFYG